MLRWCLSTVRALGGHDTNRRLTCFFSPQALQVSRSRFVRVHTDTVVPVADRIEEQDASVVASSSARSYSAGPQDALPLSLRSSANPLEGCDPCSTASSWSSYSAINALMQFLSQENVASDCPLTRSPTVIRSLYYQAESKNHLWMLDSRMLTLLLHLFGSLSIDPPRPIVYKDPLPSHFLEVSTRRTHWAFVLKVGRYKLGRGMPLQDSDRFWLMRAELAVVQARPPLEPLSTDTYCAILRARTHYHIIRRHSRHPEVHAYYVEALLAFRDPRLLDFAACDLSFLLRTHRVWHPRLQRLLYCLVIQYGGSLSTRSQEAILAALWGRACQRINGTTDLVPDNKLSYVALDDYVLDTTTIVRSLSTTLISSAGHLPNNKSTNSIGHLFFVFSPVYALPLRWSSLILFSIFNSSDMLHFNGAHWTSDHGMPQVTSCWQVVFGLATIEKIVSHEPSSATTMQVTLKEGVLETTRTLYQSWLRLIKSCSVSRDLACAVATSFFRIANVLADTSLFYNCQDLCHMHKNLEGPRTSVQTHLAAQYIAAAVRIQGPLPDVVFPVLEAFSLESEQQHQILTSAVEILAPIDAPLAYTFHTLAQGRGLGLDLKATYALAMSFAQRGALRLTLHFLNKCLFSPERRGILVSAIARSIRENPRTRHPRSVYVAIVDQLMHLYNSRVPPEHFRGHLEQLIVILARHGRGSQLFPVVLSTLKRSPNFFSSRFLVRYYRALVQHRQFSITSKLLDAITTVYPKTARSLYIFTDRTVMQTKAFRISKRITPVRGATSPRLSSRLWRRPYTGPPLGVSLQELLKSGRVPAAKRVFACAAATTSSRRCTVLGNILLHGVSRQPTARNGRRVRKVLALLEDLVKNHGFQPDRVTVNILIRVMINWRSGFNSLRLRELLDQLVRGGYATADYPHIHPPFSTRPTQFSGSSGISKLPSLISFEKHTRPLFKMFIKAFYLCNDVEAARKVVGILKAEGYKNAVVKEVRQRARSRGRVKSGQRGAIPLDATVSSID